MSKPLIRPIRTKDDAAVAAIIREVMVSVGAACAGSSIHDAEVDAMSASYAGPRAVYLVIEDGGRVLGGGGIGPLAGGDADTCELRKMYFRPALRGQGQGERVLRQLLDAARERGYRRCYLETRAGMDAARKLYLKTGFKAIGAPIGATGHSACDRHYLLEL